MSTELDLKFDEWGLIPAIIQDAHTGELLSLAYMNGESYKKTLETNETWFWSRSRSELWHKGGTSGNTQRVVEIRVDCDGDALMVLVEPAGPACHTGARSCFYRSVEDSGDQKHVLAPPLDFGIVLGRLYELIESRQRTRPEGSYTTYLFEQGLDKILKKVGEESSETIIAAKNANKKALVSEVSDLFYHLLVLLVDRGVSLGDISTELSSRSKSGT